MSQNSTFQAQLVDVDNISNSPSLLIDKPFFTIGRHPDSDFVIEKRTVSGKHAVIEQRQEAFFIVDQNSTNKTRINGAVIDPNTPQQLSDGDEIQFDKFKFIFKLEQIETPPSDPVLDQETAESPEDSGPKEDETIFFDSLSLMDDIQPPESAPPEADVEDTIFRDNSTILLENEKAEPAPSGFAEDAKTTEPIPVDPDQDTDRVELPTIGPIKDEEATETTPGDSAEKAKTVKSVPVDPDQDTDRVELPTIGPIQDEEPLEITPDNAGQDEKAADFLEGMALMDFLEESKPEPPKAGDFEAILSESSPVSHENEVGVETPPVDPDHDMETVEVPLNDLEEDKDETIFFDSSALLDDIQESEPQQAETKEDETIFFDSGSLMDDVQVSKPDQAEPEEDETIFLESGSLAETEEGTVFRQQSAPAEKTKIGNYEVIKLLGKGGFGSVWEARTKDGQPIAIKVLNPEVLENERAVRKFFHEAINLAKMDHPNICRFIDFFPHEGNYAIIMDFVQGTNLQDLLKKHNGPLPIDLARDIASQALDGFHYALQQKVLHRDIKPENITLTIDGTAKIMDFGIARLSSTESQQTSLFMISPAYTAPERFDASKTEMVDHRSDIYSLGLVFYEIFVGSHPFPTTNPTEMIVSHMSKIPTPPEDIADLPSEISDAILTALEKDPVDRFEDFAAFKMALLGEAPRMPSHTIGGLTFYGDYCKGIATLFKTYVGILKKHQKKADKISMFQDGTQIHLIIESKGDNPLRISKDLAEIVGLKK